MPPEVRPAVFAGSWYPARAAECEKQIEGFLAAGGLTPPRNAHPVGGVVPHAGWQFSGHIACNVIRHLKPDGPRQPDVVLVFGMHLHPGAPNVMMPRGAWGTPFGPIPVAEDLAAELSARFSFQVETAQRFTQDNTVELQLPFIKYFFPSAKVLALGVPPAHGSLAVGAAVAEISRRLGLAVRVVGSTDLTHYGSNYGLTGHGSGPAAVDWVRRENDRRVIEAMLDLDAERVIAEASASQSACCPGAAAAAIAAGRHLGATAAESVGYATSYERSPAESFVGYVGVVF
jgi:hypothetical protein